MGNTTGLDRRGIELGLLEGRGSVSKFEGEFLGGKSGIEFELGLLGKGRGTNPRFEEGLLGSGTGIEGTEFDGGSLEGERRGTKPEEGLLGSGTEFDGRSLEG
jgi:hypothetical protein